MEGLLMQNEFSFFGLIAAAIIIEGIVTYIKTFFKGGKFQWQQATGIALGVMVAVAYQLDLLALVGMTTQIPYLGCVLTGVLLSRGSNYLFDLVNMITNITANLKDALPTKTVTKTVTTTETIVQPNKD